MICEQLQGIEQGLLKGVEENNQDAILMIASSLEALRNPCCQLRSQDSPDSADLPTILTHLRRIRAIATSFVGVERALIERERQLTDQVNDFQNHQIQGNRSAYCLESLGEPKTAESKSEQVLNSSGMRQWMLEHIAHPFPTSADKQSIVDNTNASGLGSKGELTAGQCTLWFINTRRRSGWTAWARRFASGERARIEKLVACIRASKTFADEGSENEVFDELEALMTAILPEDTGKTRSQMAKECRVEFDKIHEWVSHGPRERVGDWMDTVIAEAKESTKRKRSKSKGKKRQLDEPDIEKEEDQDGPSVATPRKKTSRAAAPSSSLRRSQRSRREIQMIEESSADEDEVELPKVVLRERPIRRLPSSARKVSSTSSSGPSTYDSLGSLVSGRLRNVSGSSVISTSSTDPSNEQPSSSLPQTPAKGKQMPRLSVGCSTIPSGEQFAPMPRPPAMSPRVYQSIQSPHLQPGPVTQTTTTTTWHPVAPPPSMISTPLSARSAMGPRPSISAGLTPSFTETGGSHPAYAGLFAQPISAAAATGECWGLPMAPMHSPMSPPASFGQMPSFAGWQPWTG